MTEGDRYLWEDPDNGLCTKLVTVVEVYENDEVLVRSADGDEFAVFRHELTEETE